MTAQTVTLNLPEPIFRYFQQVAVATKRPMEQLVRQSVEGNLPPSVTTAPAEMRGELIALQILPAGELQRIANSQIPLAQQTRHVELLERNSAGMLMSAEQGELASLRLSADRLMLRKAYAWAILRWLGQPVPSLDELPLD